MSGLARLCRVEDVEEGSPRRAELEGLPPLAVFRVGERYFVTSDRCTHGSGDLSQGTQDGATIECPMHGGVFDVTTGQPLQFPCRIPLRTWPVTVDEGWICIAAEAEDSRAAGQ